ncbi:hypothetical protein J6590_029277 [Homalodisca vitripennis]|nr:hypothetical protein J6590_029277 [Homalodisca vitripennis]
MKRAVSLDIKKRKLKAKVVKAYQKPSVHESIKELNTIAGDVSWRGPARPGKTQSFRIHPPEFASRAEAPYSGQLMYYSSGSQKVVRGPLGVRKAR